MFFPSLFTAAGPKKTSPRIGAITYLPKKQSVASWHVVTPSFPVAYPFACRKSQSGLSYGVSVHPGKKPPQEQDYELRHRRPPRQEFRPTPILEIAKIPKE